MRTVTAQAEGAAGKDSHPDEADCQVKKDVYGDEIWLMDRGIKNQKIRVTCPRCSLRPRRIDGRVSKTVEQSKCGNMGCEQIAEKKRLRTVEYPPECRDQAHGSDSVAGEPAPSLGVRKSAHYHSL
ncbi:MAG: hypothetical protein WB973_02510 [Thermoanaerobaculia bacterium]